MERISSVRSVKSASAESYVGSPLLSIGTDVNRSPSFGGGGVSPPEQSVSSRAPSFRELTAVMEPNHGSFLKPSSSALGSLNPPAAVSPLSSDLTTSSPTPSYAELPSATEASLPENVSLIVEPNFQAMYYEIADRIALEYNRCHSLLNPHELMLLSDCEVRRNNRGGVPARYLRTLLRILFRLLVSAAPKKKGRHPTWEDRAFLEPIAKLGERSAGMSSSSSSTDALKELREFLEEEEEEDEGNARGNPTDESSPWVDYLTFSSIVLRCATEWCAILRLKSDLLPAQVEVCHRRLRELLDKEKRRVPPLTVSRVQSSPYAGAISGTADPSRGPDLQGDKVLRELKAQVRPARVAAAVEICKSILYDQVSATRNRLEQVVTQTHLITQANERQPVTATHSSIAAVSGEEDDVYVTQWGSHRERVLEKALDTLETCDSELGLKLDRMELKEEDEALRQESKKSKSRPSTAGSTSKPVGGVFIKNELSKMRDAYLNRLRVTKRVVDTVERAADEAIRKEKVLAKTWVHDRFIAYPPSPAIEPSEPRSRSPSAPTEAAERRNEAPVGKSIKPQLSSSRPRSSTGRADFRALLRPASCDLYHQVVDPLPDRQTSPSHQDHSRSPERRISPVGVRKVDCWRPADQEDKRAALASGMLKMLSDEHTLPGPSRYPDRNGNAALADVVVASRKRLARHYAILVETLGEREKQKLKLAAEEAEEKSAQMQQLSNARRPASAKPKELPHHQEVANRRNSSVITRAHLALLRPGQTPLERHPQGKGKGPLTPTVL